MSDSRRLDDAILQAVTYAGLFDYPLTLAQLREALPVPASEAALADRLTASVWLAPVVTWRGGLVYPAGRDDLPGVRRRRESITLPRLRADTPALRFLTGLPFVRAVAISGSLAHLNADDGEAAGDLDLFVIAAPGHVWLTTVATLVVARLRGWRRRLCLNYVVADDALALSPSDLFSANQIVHLRPVAGEAAYRRFLDANPWVAAHYPNFEPRRLEARPAGAPATRWTALLAAAAPLLEPAARALYGWHLGRRSAGWATRDGVRLEAGCLKLHTSSHRQTVMRRYETALRAARSAAEAAAAAGAAGGWTAGPTRLEPPHRLRA